MHPRAVEEVDRPHGGAGPSAARGTPGPGGEERASPHREARVYWVLFTIMLAVLIAGLGAGLAFIWLPGIRDE